MNGVATGNYPWIPQQQLVNKIPMLRGSFQAVYDNFEKHPWNPFWRYRAMMPLNDVMMSKIDFMTPKSVQVITAKNFSQTFSLKGDNIGGLTHSATGWHFCPPQTVLTLPFVQVDLKMASYLQQRAYSKMSSAQYDFGVPIGEIAETAAMLSKPLRGIVNLSSFALAGIGLIRTDGLRTVFRIAKNATAKQSRRLMRNSKQHPLSSSLRIVDETANHWLEYKFGVCPLIEDIHKVLQFAEENVGPHLGLQVVRVKGFSDDNTVVRPGYRFDLHNGVIGFNASGTVRTIDTHTGGIYWRNKINAPIVNFMESIGFSPFQLPSLAYELIPLSFVVDRFIDIKSFIRGNIGSLTKETFGNFTTRKVITTWTSFLEPRVMPDGLLARAEPGASSVVQMHQMARSVNLTRPNFPVVNPRWRAQLVADATNMALIWGRLRTFVGK